MSGLDVYYLASVFGVECLLCGVSRLVIRIVRSMECLVSECPVSVVLSWAIVFSVQSLVSSVDPVSGVFIHHIWFTQTPDPSFQVTTRRTASTFSTCQRGIATDPYIHLPSITRMVGGGISHELNFYFYFIFLFLLGADNRVS